MSVTTSNAYGKISVTEEAIAQVTAIAASECYGIVDLVNKNIPESFMEIFRKAPVSKGVRVVAGGNKISLSLNVIMKYGVTIDAVAESLKKTVRYTVERFSGMTVKDIAINVVGVKV